MIDVLNRWVVDMYEIVGYVAVVDTKYGKEFLTWKLCDLLLATIYCSLF